MKKRGFLILSLFCFSFLGMAQNSTIDYFKPEYIKSKLIKVATWQIEHPKNRAPNDWTSAVFYSGLFAAWEVTHSQSIYYSLIQNGKDANWLPYQRSYHADDIAISQTYIDLYRIEKKTEMIKATTDSVARFISQPYPVRGEECIKYWWADALFMAPPVLIKLGKTINRLDYLKYNDKLYHEAYDMLYNKTERLFVRDLRFTIKNDGTDKLEKNGKPMYWSRGNGWVIAGLAIILKELPVDYPERPFYLKLFKDMTYRIVEIQQADGLWSPGLLYPEAYPSHGEVSGSGLFCFGLAYGVNAGILKDKKFIEAAQKAWVGLNKCVNDEGRVVWVQGAADRPVARDWSYNSEPYGTGAFLLAGSEIMKMKKSKK
jgi:unsaturated rhamnogalacturonyl hydrolase